MMKHKKTTMMALLFAMILILVGCSEATTEDTASTESLQTEQQETIAGTLFLKVNPEIAVSYDAHGNVYSVSGKNDDAKKLLEGYTGFEGKPSKEVISELVKKIADEGYFVEEIEGESKKIVLEVERGSKLPSDVFLEDVVKEIQAFIDRQDWSNPITLESTDYEATDFDTRTDYDATDYVTDYNDATDYEPAVIPVKPTTPAKEVAPAKPATPAAPAPADSPYTDYSDSPYSDYSAPAPAPAPSDSDYSDYDDVSDYDEDSDYSDYDDSDYDD